MRSSSLWLLCTILIACLPTLIHGSFLFDTISRVFQPVFPECAADRPCPEDPEMRWRCRRGRCIPTARNSTEIIRPIHRKDDIRAALLSAIITGQTFNTGEQLPMALASAGRRGLETCEDFQLLTSYAEPEGDKDDDDDEVAQYHHKFAIYSGPTFNVLAFKGTTTTKEWISDFTAYAQPCTMVTKGCGRVHAGFQRALKQMIPKLNEALLHPQVQYARKPLLITGHSLGGALATLAALHVTDKFQSIRILGVVTLGSPRVGDHAFAQTFQRLLTKQHPRIYLERVFMVADVNNLAQTRWDPISLVPPRAFGGFVHVIPGTAVQCLPKHLDGEDDKGDVTDNISKSSEKDKKEECSARQLHNISGLRESLKQMLDRRFWVWHKCGRL